MSGTVTPPAVADTPLTDDELVQCRRYMGYPAMGGINSGQQPFGPDAGRVVEVTGTDAQVGYLVDRMGNVTPRENRKGPIPDGQPAYLEGPPVPAPMSGPLGVALTSAAIQPSTDPDHPDNWPQNRPTKQEAADGDADHPQA